MRTKALICAAVLAASLASSMAQSNVYSLNVVGYYNVTVAPGLKVMVANQLNTTNNMLSALIPNGPPDAQVFKFNGIFTTFTYDDVDLAWEPDASLNPGEGCFYVSPLATTLTFVGEVLQGNLTVNLPIATKVLVSSKVPQAGTVETLGVPGEPDDQIFTWDPVLTHYTTYTFDDVDLQWEPDPSLAVGQSFFYVKAGGSSSSLWVRNFTVQ